MKCSVYIDESGDTGIKTVRADGRPGASPYFVLAAAVMQRATSIHAAKLLDSVIQAIPKRWKHATELNHSQTVFFARQSSTVNARYFAVISKKSTLEGYRDEISWEPDKYYNKCTHYLLENVGKYLQFNGFSGEPPDVIFENRNHDFDKLIRYIGKIKERPMHEHARFISVFNPFSFVQRKKEDEALLRFADLAAHAVFQCVNKTERNFSIPEPRYLVEMSTRFGCDDSGRILGTGIKCIHSIGELELEDDVSRLLQNLRAHPARTALRDS